MAFQLSPGVLIQEQDLTNVVPAVATTIGGICGDFEWGPVHEIVSVDSENNLVDRFGKPRVTEYEDFMTAGSFLAYGSNCLTVREVGSSALNSTSDGTGLLIKNNSVTINGDGETSRDFCYVDNAVQANILAGLTQSESATNQIYNIAVGEQTTLNELFNEIKNQLLKLNLDLKEVYPNYGDFRDGDVRHSLADIKKANQLLGYSPEFNVKEGLAKAISWYL